MPILFRGLGQAAAESELTVRFLEAPPTASSPDSPATDVISLVSAVQARNNARVAIVGSLELFSDVFFKVSILPDSSNIRVSSKSSHGAFSISISACEAQQHLS